MTTDDSWTELAACCAACLLVYAPIVGTIYLYADVIREFVWRIT